MKNALIIIGGSIETVLTDHFLNTVTPFPISGFNPIQK